MSDYYETLQVHPKADAEAIQSAYERLRQRYDPARLEGVADELVEVAHRRRDDIELAYAVLSDSRRRAAYDAELQVPPSRHRGDSASSQAVVRREDSVIDYRPLTPARRKERSSGFESQPYLNAAEAQPTTIAGKMPPWAVPAILTAVLTCVVLLVSFLVVGEEGATLATAPNDAAAVATSASAAAGGLTESEQRTLDQFEGQIIAARQIVQQLPDNADAWIQLGNALYDSAQVALEKWPDSELYVERLPRWLEASEAYSKALEIAPGDALVQADMAISLCYYGAGINDAERLTEGLSAARSAVKIAPDDGRVLLSLGICLISANPPQTTAAVEQWTKALDFAQPGSPVAFEAQRLIDLYSQ